jgi:hypothetical protein
LAKFRHHIPEFFGTLRLEGRMDDAGQILEEVEDGIPEVS